MMDQQVLRYALLNLNKKEALCIYDIIKIFRDLIMEELRNGENTNE